MQVPLECKQESLLFTDLKTPLDTLDRPLFTVEPMRQPTTLQQEELLLTLHLTPEWEVVTPMEVLLAGHTQEPMETR